MQHGQHEDFRAAALGLASPRPAPSVLLRARGLLRAARRTLRHGSSFCRTRLQQPCHSAIAFGRCHRTRSCNALAGGQPVPLQLGTYTACSAWPESRASRSQSMARERAKPVRNYKSFRLELRQFPALRSVILRSPDAFSRGDEGSLYSFDFVRHLADLGAWQRLP